MNTAIVTWSFELPHAPFVTVHWNTCVPTDRPVICVVADAALLKVPAPLTTVHWPLAGAGAALAFICTLLVGVQMLWSGPALALPNGEYTVMITSSCVTPMQGPLLMLQRKRFTPAINPVTVVVGEFAFAKVPLPCTTFHCPTAGAFAVLPASVALLAGKHSCWSGPAFAAC